MKPRPPVLQAAIDARVRVDQVRRQMAKGASLEEAIRLVKTGRHHGRPHVRDAHVLKAAIAARVSEKLKEIR
jgi:hypothetical protein